MYEYLDTLNEAQRCAATHIDGPILMVAGAGSGKTTTLINRVAYMVDSGIDPRSILMLTFTNAAATNMVRKAKSLSNEACGDITACTFHSFCAMVLRQYHKEASLPANFAIITPPEELEAVKLCKSRLGYSEDKTVPPAKKIVNAYSYSINFLEKLGEVIEALSLYEYDEAKICEVVEAYRDYKKKNGFLTYDDLLLEMCRLLLNGKVRDALEEQYKYVSVDEYQDTNRIQERISFLLTKRCGNLAVVGDDYQSIYRFRGADVSNIIRFEERYLKANNFHVKRVVMDVNYRSVDGILSVANEVMRENADFGFPKVMRGVKGSYAIRPQLIRPYSGEDEAEMVVSSIEEWMSEGNSLAEYAVLSRSSKSTSLVEVMLDKRGIPYEKLGGLKFLEHQCVLDMMSFFKVYTNNSDELSWFHLLDIVPGIGGAYASKVVGDILSGGDLSCYKTKRFFGDLLTMVEFVRRMQKNLPTVPIEQIFDETQETYFYFVEKKIDNARLRDEEKRDEMREQMESDRDTIAVLRDMAVSYSTLTQFLDSIVLDNAPQAAFAENKLVVSTIHSAKGLEWSHVDIVDCLLGVIPDDKSFLKEDLDEELRCLYVALTRAKDSLSCYAPMGLRSKGKFYGTLCPYLESSYNKGLFSSNFHSTNTYTSGTYKKVSSHKKIYLNVPYYDKDLAKRLGARWDGCGKSWYSYEDNPKIKELLQLFGY